MSDCIHTDVLLDLGALRGALMTTTLPPGVSEALERVIRFVLDGERKPQSTLTTRDEVVASHLAPNTHQVPDVLPPGPKATYTRRGAEPKLKAEDLPAVKANFEAGMTFPAIGREHGCTGQTVVNFLQRHGIDTRRKTRAENHSTPSRAIREEKPVIVKAKDRTPIEAAELLGSDLPNDEIEEDERTELHVTSPADRWIPSPLSLDDWPDIQGILATGHTRESIASDYDVPVEDLNDFIEERLKAIRARRGEPPGEAAPLNPSMAGAAA